MESGLEAGMVRDWGGLRRGHREVGPGPIREVPRSDHPAHVVGDRSTRPGRHEP